MVWQCAKVKSEICACAALDTLIVQDFPLNKQKSPLLSRIMQFKSTAANSAFKSGTCKDFYPLTFPIHKINFLKGMKNNNTAFEKA